MKQGRFRIKKTNTDYKQSDQWTHSHGINKHMTVVYSKYSNNYKIL